MCHMSHVTCHVSPVTCHLSHDFNFCFYLFMFLKYPSEKMEKSDGASRWRVCYQRGLPRLVFVHEDQLLYYPLINQQPGIQ